MHRSLAERCDPATKTGATIRQGRTSRGREPVRPEPIPRHETRKAAHSAASFLALYVFRTASSGAPPAVSSAGPYLGHEHCRRTERSSDTPANSPATGLGCRNHDPSNDQTPSMVLMWTWWKQPPSSSRAHSPRLRRTPRRTAPRRRAGGRRLRLDALAQLQGLDVVPVQVRLMADLPVGQVQAHE
jgi:hypothetical protein